MHPALKQRAEEAIAAARLACARGSGLLDGRPNDVLPVSARESSSSTRPSRKLSQA
jgi:hypothetical protein